MINEETGKLINGGDHSGDAVMPLSLARQRLLDLRNEIQRSRYGAIEHEGELENHHDQAVAIAVQYGNDDKLAQVLAALARVDAGSYGICVDCADSINPARLELRPFAIRCIACQQVAEGQPGARLL